MEKKAYISGKMTGLEPCEYCKLFYEAEKEFINRGYKVVNPCDISDVVLAMNPNADYEDFMAVDLKLLETCSDIVMLENWKESSGAQREKEFAEQLGIKVHYFVSW